MPPAANSSGNGSDNIGNGGGSASGSVAPTPHFRLGGLHNMPQPQQNHPASPAPSSSLQLLASFARLNRSGSDAGLHAPRMFTPASTFIPRRQDTETRDDTAAGATTSQHQQQRSVSPRPSSARPATPNLGRSIHVDMTSMPLTTAALGSPQLRPTKPLQTSTSMNSFAATATLPLNGTTSAALAPIQSAQSTGAEINIEINELRRQLNEARENNTALAQTNAELHLALQQVTERSKLLSHEHTRFLEEFRDRTQKSKQQLVEDRTALKTNLEATNTRLEELEALNQHIEADKSHLQEQLNRLQADHDTLQASHAEVIEQRDLLLQKEIGYLEVQAAQTRNIEELNIIVVRIQEEREGWFMECEKLRAELQTCKSQCATLEETVHFQEEDLTKLNAQLLTSDEEVVNLTQTVATHLEQIANLSQQNKELHETLVKFTDQSPQLNVFDENEPDLDVLMNHRIDLVQLSPALGASTNFASSLPFTPRSSAINPANSRSTTAAFSLPTSGLSTLHLPAAYLLHKLQSYIVWILEHKQVLENMLLRKEKLRKELEEQIVISGVEAQLADATTHLSGSLRSSPSPRTPTKRSASPHTIHASALSASQLSSTIQNTVSPVSSSLLLPSMLQHTLHDIQELTYLTQHDRVQFENFSLEKTQILQQCSTHGLGKHNMRQVQSVWKLWRTRWQMRCTRRQVMHRLLQQNYLRQIAHSFGRWQQFLLVQIGRTKLNEKSQELKLRVVSAMVRNTDRASDYAQQLTFQSWRQLTRRNITLRQRFVTTIVTSMDKRITEMWHTWKANTLRLRHQAAVQEGELAVKTITSQLRQAQYERMRKVLSRQLTLNATSQQRMVFLSWRTWSQTRRARKRQALKRIIYICAGQGMLIKVWNTWKMIRKRQEIATAQSDLITTKQSFVERFERQRDNFLAVYTLLRARYNNFKVYHWWRLAYIDSQWMKREEQWRQAVTYQKSLQVRTLIAMHHSNAKKPAFQAWREMTKRNKQGKVKAVKKIFARLLNGHLYQGFQQWKRFVEESRVEELQGKLTTSQDNLAVQKQRFIANLISKWRHHHLSRAFHQLVMQTQIQRARKREVLDRTLRRLQQTQLWNAWRQWKSYCEKQAITKLQNKLVEQKGKFSTLIVQRWKLGTLTPAFKQWRARVAERRQHKRELLDRTCRKLEHATLWRAFRSWVKFSDQAAITQLKSTILTTSNQAGEQRMKLAHHMLVKWRMTNVKERFLAWKNYTTKHRSHKRQILERTFKHLTSGVIGRAFTQWRKYVENDRIAVMHARLNEGKAKTAQQVITKWRTRICTPVFLNWRSYTRRCKLEKREAIDRVMKRLINSAMYRAWRQWNEFVDQTKVAYMKRKFIEQKEEYATQLLKSQQEVAQQKQARIRTLIQRWRGASLSTRFQQWRIYAHTQRQKKKVRLDQVFRRMIASSLWKGWKQWRMYVEQHRSHEAQVANHNAMASLQQQTSAALHLSRRRHLLTKALDRMSNLLLFSGWRSWLEFTQQSRANDITKEKMKLHAQTLQLQKKQEELVKTHASYNLEKQQRIVDKTLRRIAYATAYKALRIWKKFAEDAAVHEMQQKLISKEKQLKLMIVTDRIARHRQTSLQPVFQRWAKHTAKQREHKREVLGKMCKRLMNIMVWKALRHWKNVAHTLTIDTMRTTLETKLAHQKRMRIENLISAWRNHSLQPRFLAWRAYVRTSNKRKIVMRQIFARITQIQLYNAFRQWKQWRQAQLDREAQLERQRVIIDRTFKRLSSSLLYCAFRTWITYADSHKQAELKSSLLSLRMSAVTAKFNSLNRSQIKTNFIEWRRYVQSVRKDRSLSIQLAFARRCNALDRVCRHISTIAISKSFLLWRTATLRDRLLMNDKLGEYSEIILELRKKSEEENTKLQEYLTENQKLKSSMLSIKHKQQTLELLHEKQRENRAVLFAHNGTLARTFRTFYQNAREQRRKKVSLHKAWQHVKENALLRAIQQWRQQVMRHRGHMLQHALDTAKKQLDQCLGRVLSLESQLAQRTAEVEEAASVSQQIQLNARAQEMNHALEKQMPNDRELALAQEVDTLAAKLELLLKEVKERGQHITFLSAENQRLSTIVKTNVPASSSSTSFAPSTSFTRSFDRTAANPPLNTSSGNNTVSAPIRYAASRSAAGPSMPQMTALAPQPPTTATTRFFPATTSISFG